MTQYAKYISETQIQYPTDADFPGVINWQNHDARLRAKGFVPLTDNPPARVGSTPTPCKFAFTEQTGTRIEPRPYEVDDFDPETGEKTGTHTEWRDTEITIDTSYITATDWEWTAIVAPDPEPLPTVFYKSEVLAALKAKDLYDAAFEMYKASAELSLFWATYLEIDIEDPVCAAVIAQIGLSQEVVDDLRQWIVDARKAAETNG